MSPIVKKILDEKTSVIQLMTGVTKENEPFYAYILFPADVFEKINDQLIKGQISNLTDYGMILYIDYGTTIPEGLTEKIVSEFKENYIKNNI